MTKIYKSPVLINDKNLSKIVLSNRVPVGKKGCKYFIWYEDGKNVRLLCIMVPIMTAYRRDFDETRYIW